MKLLITGAFGNIGQAIVREAHRRNHEITVFEKTSTCTRKLARRYRKRIKNMQFGDIRDIQAVEKAVENQEGVIHLAGVIPPLSERNGDLCYAVNVEGTRNVVEAILRQKKQPAFVMASTVTVAGSAQYRTEPVGEHTPYHAVNNYNKSKIMAEELIRASALDCWSITRLGAVMPTVAKYRLKSMEFGFKIPYHARVEIITDTDVAIAQLNAVEKLHDKTIPSGNIYMLGGGIDCQTQYGPFIGGFFQTLGLKAPEKSFFTDEESFLDWMDSKKAQQDLQFQNDDLQAYYGKLKNQYHTLLPIIHLFKKTVRKILVRQSPYYQIGKRKAYEKRHAYNTR